MVMVVLDAVVPLAVRLDCGAVVEVRQGGEHLARRTATVADARLIGTHLPLDGGIFFQTLQFRPVAFARSRVGQYIAASYRQRLHQIRLSAPQLLPLEDAKYQTTLAGIPVPRCHGGSPKRARPELLDRVGL